MGFIILDFVLWVVWWIVLVHTNMSEHKITLFVSIFLLCGILFLGFCAPGTPVEKTLTHKIDIISLSDGMHVSGGGPFYVRINTDNSYSYYYEVDSEFKQAKSERSYKQGIVKGDVTIIEYDSTSDEVPALYMYESGTRSNFWTFDLDGIRNEYVFRVPKGTVVQQFELNGR